jgi:hypothetical protein
LSSNAYEIELPSGVGISPIFNIAYLYSFNWTEDVSTNELVSDGDHTIGWKEQLPRVLQNDIETILHRKVLKKTRERVFQYLVKWKAQPMKDATWMTREEISNYGIDLEEPMNIFLFPESLMQHVIVKLRINHMGQ